MNAIRQITPSTATEFARLARMNAAYADMLAAGSRFGDGEYEAARERFEAAKRGARHG